MEVNVKIELSGEEIRKAIPKRKPLADDEEVNVMKSE